MGTKEILIRHASEADLARICELFAQFDHAVEESKIVSFYQQSCKNDNFLLNVSTNQDNLITGVIQVNFHPSLHRLKFNAYVNSLVVDEDYRSQGIGAKLLESAEQVARERDCHYVHLVSDLGRTRAHEFYKQNGCSMGKYEYFRKVVSKD